MYMYMYMHMYMYMVMFKFMYMYMSMSMSMCMYMYKYMYTHMDLYMYMYMYLYMSTLIYMYMYIDVRSIAADPKDQCYHESWIVFSGFCDRFTFLMTFHIFWKGASDHGKCCSGPGWPRARKHLDILAPWCVAPGFMIHTYIYIYT